MNAHILKSRIKGTIKAIPSKSYTHRALICAALSKGESIISNVVYSEDIVATISGIKAIGAEVIEVNSTTLKVIGFKNETSRYFNAKESGTTMRMFMPIVAALIDSEFIIYGEGNLLNRPQHGFDGILKYTKTIEYVKVMSFEDKSLYELNGNISSQFVSGLLYALPLLDKPKIIRVLKPFVSHDYVYMTINMLGLFGVKIEIHEEEDYVSYSLVEGSFYQATNYIVEGDYSNAAFFMVLGALAGEVIIEGLNLNSLQGDMKIINILREVGVNIQTKKNGISFSKPKVYNSFEADMSIYPDLGPILSILALFTPRARLYNINVLRYKESDRVKSIVQLLKGVGSIFELDDNEIIIHHRKLTIKDLIVDSGYDHRICMSGVVLGLIYPLVVLNIECVKKSYPSFFIDVKKVNGKFTYDR